MLERSGHSYQRMLELSPENRQEMGIRNRQLCLQRNTEEAFLKLYVKLIDKLKINSNDISDS